MRYPQNMAGYEQTPQQPQYSGQQVPYPQPVYVPTTPEGLIRDNRVNGTSGDAFRDQWLAERSPPEVAALRALAESAGQQISGGTILRPQLYSQRVSGITAQANRTFTMIWPFSYFGFIEKITFTIRAPVLDQALDFSTTFLGQISPGDYIDGQLSRATSEQIFLNPTPLSEWAGTGKSEYIWSVLPFVEIGGQITGTFSVSDSLTTAESVTVTFHMRRFPSNGY